MQSITYNFESAINDLLKNYFNNEELNQLYSRINSSTVKYNDISARINEFYISQLNISMDDRGDRLKIDRTITFSEKNLNGDKFYNFLLDLGYVCLTGGKLNLASEIFRKIKKDSDSEKIKAQALLALSDIFSRRADWGRSLQLIDEASIIFNLENDNKGLSKCENLRGTIFGEKGDFENAKQYFLNSLSLINPDEEKELAANLESNLGIIENIQGCTEASLLHLNNALSKYLVLNNHVRIAEIKLNIGMVLHEDGQFELAETTLDECIEVSKNKGLYPTLNLAYLAKSHVLISEEKYGYAFEFAEKAMDLGNSLDDKLTIADAYKIKGIIERKRGDFQSAEFYLLTSLRMNTNLQNTMNIAETSFELGILYQESGEVESRDGYLNSSLSYFKKINAKSKSMKIEEILKNGFNSKIRTEAKNGK